MIEKVFNQILVVLVFYVAQPPMKVVIVKVRDDNDMVDVVDDVKVAMKVDLENSIVHLNLKKVFFFNVNTKGIV